MINPQIANMQTSIKHCTTLSQKSLKSSFYAMFCYGQILIGTLYTIFVRRKSMYLQTCGSFISENRKKIGSANRKSVSASYLRKFLKPSLFNSANLRICKSRNLFADRPALVFHKILYTRGYCIR
jgi:hypothetical protein